MRELGRGYQEGDEGGGPWVVSEQWGSKTQGCTLVGVGDLFLGDKWWVSLQRPGLLCVCVCAHVCVCVCHALSLHQQQAQQPLPSCHTAGPTRRLHIVPKGTQEGRGGPGAPSSEIQDRREPLRS